MEGPIGAVRSGRIKELKNLRPLYEWIEGKSSLFLDAVDFKGIPGSILCYHNPPVHQVGNPALDAFLEALKTLSEGRNSSFFIVYGANDPVHAGGDLKESLNTLEKTLAERKALEAQGGLAEEIDCLYEWGDRRLHKAFDLYRGIRRVSHKTRVISVCGGGTRYGGSAEIPLMADILVGDSRSGICFSEALIGLIPGWSGVGRTITKAGFLNAKYLAETATELKASQLLAIGIYNCVVEVPFPLPRKERTSDPAKDEVKYIEALQKNNDDTGLILLPRALELAICAEHEIPSVGEEERLSLISPEALSAEVRRRSNPDTYEGLWGRSLKEIRGKIDLLGRPLAPQSIEALETLFAASDSSSFIEEQFVEEEMKADARLYRDPRLQAGIVATLEQTVADYRGERRS